MKENQNRGTASDEKSLPGKSTESILTPVELFNRELSWLDFNSRVLAEARNPDVPLLERLKFLAITANNLDEFLMVRGGSMKDLIAAGLAERTPDGLTPKQQWKVARDRTKKLLKSMYQCLEELLTEAAKAGVKVLSVRDLSKKEKQSLHEYCERHIEPILTPLAIDPGHPFPFLSNLSLTIGIVLEGTHEDEHVVLMKVPTVLPRWIPVPGSSNKLVPVEQVIANYAGTMFPGLKVKNAFPFRVVRNADLALRSEEIEDLLKSVETEVRRRERREVVWIEVEGRGDASVLDLLMSSTDVLREDIFFAPDFLRLSDLMQIYEQTGKSSLRDKPFNPRIPAELASSEDVFASIRRGDLLLHRPYESFGVVIELIQAAAEDPAVMAIKMTLYRTDRGSPILAALAAAATKGKQVTAVVELQARFDESKNIEWAKQLEQAGVQVVYGLVGIKTHCKVCLIVRREGSELRRYVHLSTGNYNARTAGVYTDVDLLTQDEAIGHDAAQLMNILTGFSVASVQEVFSRETTKLEWKRFAVAPINYQERILQLIEREMDHASAGREAHLIAKLNALVDPKVIAALYRASRAGVRIDLIIRGICCLVPEKPGLSDNIRVISIVDRFLEHSRVFFFRNGGETEVYVSSGDWMPRNFMRRVEVMFPILDPKLKTRLVDQILSIQLTDHVKAWRLGSDGSYKRRTPGPQAVRSQDRFIELARQDAIRLGPYEEILAEPGSFRRKMKKAKKKEKK